VFERNRIMDPKVSGRSRYARIGIGDDYGHEDENADRCRSISNRELPAPSSVSNTNAFRFVTALPLSFILSPEGRGLGEGGLSRVLHSY
jgi:hypothetical protein